MSKGTKKLLTVGGLLLLVVGLGLLYYFVPKGKSTEDADTTDTKEISLTSIKQADVQKITIESDEGKIVLKKQGDSFVFNDNQDIPVDEDKLSAMFTALAPIKAIQEVKADENVSTEEYGLDKPSMVVTVETSDKTYSCSLGSEAPVIGGYYGILDEESKIYAISDDFYTAFNYSEVQLTKADTFPGITSDYVTGLRVENTKGKNFEIKLASDTDKVESYNDYNMLAPYKQTISADQTNVKTLLGDMVGLTFKDLVEYKCSDMKKYGLAKPWATITFDYYEVTGTSATTSTDEDSDTTTATIPEEDKEYKQCVLYIGKEDADGNYYVNLKGSKGVYTMDSNTVKAKTEINAFEYADHCIYVGKINDLKGFDITVGKKTMKVTCKSVTTPATGDTEETTTTTYYINGKQIGEDDESDFLDVYSAEFLLELSGVVDSSVKPKSNTQVMSIVYHPKEGKDTTIKYYPYDGSNFYRVEKNGVSLFLTDKRGVDDVAERFMKYNK